MPRPVSGNEESGAASLATTAIVGDALVDNGFDFGFFYGGSSRVRIFAAEV